MLKFSVEPKRLQEMIRKALMNDSFPNAIATFSPTGVEVGDSSLRTKGSFCTFTPQYFKTYEVDEEHDVVFNHALLEGLSALRFSTEEEVTVEVDFEGKKFLIASNKGFDWRPNLSEETGQKPSFGKEMVAGIGYLPNDPREDRQLRNQFATSVDSLATPKVEQASLRIVDRALTLELDYSGPFKRPITLESSKVRKIDVNMLSTVFVEDLTNVLANFQGDMWVNMYDKALFFTQVTTDFTMMFFIGTS